MSSDLSLERKVDRVNEKLTSLLIRQKQTATLVKVSIIQDLTGWDKKTLRKARANGLVKQVKNKEGIWYVLESVPEMFIINKTLS